MSLVLVVDDAKYKRAVWSKYLHEAGHEVIEASDGAEAVSLFEERQPDVVFLDLVMPVMDGKEALRRIRELDPDARVAIVSAMGTKVLVDETRALGARAYWRMPQSQGDLPRIMDACLGDGPEMLVV